MNPNEHSGGTRGVPIVGYKGKYNGPEHPERKPGFGSTKDTRRWCRGRVGVEHTPVWQYWFGNEKWDWQVFKCTACGRHVDIRTVPANKPSHVQDSEKERR